ncbi:hypothetical protein F4777DRAFT_501719 [Nemania sp. FL0916]|nr:hypothetical protein F4777DRAFT_501719 [Nemania sp. FL0916]
MPGFTIAEPHPTVGQNTYTHSGRGGAGNYFRAPATTPASGVPTTQPKTAAPSVPSNFYSGRGGAGNACVSATRPLMSFDEEFALQSQAASKRVGYVGRGGAGNVYDSAHPFTTASRPRRKDSDSSHSSSSSSSSSSIVERVSSVFSRR